MAWIGTIFYLSSQSHPKGASSADLIPIIRGDLAIHFGLYFILGALTFIALKSVRDVKPQAYIRVLVVSMVGLVATADEIYQAFVSVRTSSVWDWLADMAGGASAVLVMERVWPFIKLKMPARR
jgi:VanZ family protein